MKHAILIMAHNQPTLIEKTILLLDNKSIDFYIHLDKKVEINRINNQDLPNVHFVEDIDRVDITWGGFSMVQATLNLVRFALSHDHENSFFHLN